MEPITTAAIVISAWEIIGKPFAEKTRDYYSEKILDKLPELWHKFPSVSKDEQEVIKEVILEIPDEQRKDEISFKKHLNNNLKIKNSRFIKAKIYNETIVNSGNMYFS